MIINEPVHTVWKKGTGPVWKINETTGEIICLVQMPATYKTITKRIVKTPATTKEIDSPAVYKTVTVRELVSDAKEIRQPIPTRESQGLHIPAYRDRRFRRKMRKVRDPGSSCFHPVIAQQNPLLGSWNFPHRSQAEAWGPA
uniref:Uncharacterized protein n=1 Tax=Candidatus Kentrum sp. MB TaxID=2138164 RepID=A0A450Y0R9_9GAMM|nr:MAG: hypothetical protein BECKMB1821G_GA0114241_11052 [Candidatus Kentron sp. MB]VFK35147.1 MAG: hypothetical protein BECKMB1821I_GA0114274_11022 [Candidatus Kentron sp. MB]VFK77169.1 MAG: hypothetical protein BECKMB1821H_GA0114242_110510 [Candidatus Kentron sp. MB]